MNVCMSYKESANKKELMLQKELTLINQISQRNVWFVIIGYEFEPYVCNKCHDISMMVYDLDGFIIVNIKGVDYRCFVFKMSKNTAIKMLNNSLLDYKGTLWIWILVQTKHLLK